MAETRLPRKLISGWVKHKRPRGRPQFTYGHSLNKTLGRAGITTKFSGTKDAEGWYDLAQDREAWRKLIHSTALYPKPSNT